MLQIEEEKNQITEVIEHMLSNLNAFNYLLTKN